MASGEPTVSRAGPDCTLTAFTAFVDDVKNAYVPHAPSTAATTIAAVVTATKTIVRGAVGAVRECVLATDAAEN